MNKALKHIAVFLCLCVSAVAINSPEIRCVNVQPNGTVILSWQPPSDPNNEFKSYEVYSSTGLNGPYTPESSIPVYNQPAYTSPCNANQQPYFFFIRVKNTAGVESPAIDTVKTIFLILTSPPNSSIATFQWNDFHFPLPAGESSAYKIFKESPIGTWTQIATIPVKPLGGNYPYRDSITACYDSINYRVELFDPILMCTSVSNIKGAYFKDMNAPAAPLLDSVSVNYGGQSTLGIHPSYSSDVKCYVIYKWDPTVGSSGSWIAIDTVCNNNMSFIYTDPNSNPGSSSVEYSVAALDNCNNLGIIASNTQATIYLHSTYDICKRAASLTWNSYKNMAGGVNHYEILCSVNGGAYTHIADTNATVYLHKGLMQGSNYCYLVRAHSNLKTLALKDSITSSSNKYCINPSSANTPLYVYLNDVSVIAPANEIEVKWYIDKNVRVGGFTIYRADTYNGPYAYAGSTNYTAQSNYTFINDNVNINSQKYYYYVMVLDTCLNPIMHTDSSHTILLQAAATGNFKATLTWNDYGKWLGNVSGFNIYRSLDGIFSGGPIATVPAGIFSYEDDLSNYTTYNGKFTYYVEAIEGAGDQYGFTEKSESNYADVYIDASMYVPNAFVPKGHNKIFLPIGDYIEKTDYKFSIFDRWGVKIFETTNETEGWDGGHYEEGIYAYHIEYKTALGEFRHQKGTVMMIR